VSYFLNPINALDRLRREWKEHNGLIVAVDFDSTLCPYKQYEIDVDSELIRQLVRELAQYGCTIIIWTAAEKERHEGIKQYLHDRAIPFHYFNEDAPTSRLKYMTRKLYYNILLDDRAGLYEVYTMLCQLLAEIKYLHCVDYVENER
jgi:DNA-binding LacI/PurR family transcriptional regulator